MRFFQSVTSAEEAKKLYRKLARENHPDAGGNTEIMAQINNEYDEYRKNSYVRQDSSADFKAKIDAIIKFDGIDIEIIGTWIWVSGDTYAIRKELGKDGLGFQFSKNKKAWYWYEGEYKAMHRKNFTLDEVRGMHDTKTVKTSGKNFKRELAGA